MKIIQSSFQLKRSKAKCPVKSVLPFSYYVSIVLNYLIRIQEKKMYTIFKASNRPSLGQLRKFSISQITDTIYGLATGPVTKSGVSIIRISGPGASQCLSILLGDKSIFPEPKVASLRKLYHPRITGKPDSFSLLDNALVLWFPAVMHNNKAIKKGLRKGSFTGEDVVELHVHGSRAVVTGIFSAFDDINARRDRILAGMQLRPAERGEFTRRAFENGRMSLVEVEGLADLLDADSSQQRIQALNQMEGHFRKILIGWK